MTSEPQPAPATETLVVGVDGGGTKTEAVIGALGRDGNLRPLGRGVAGPANLQSRSAHEAWQQCVAAIESALDDCSHQDRAWSRSHWDACRITTGLFAMAGAGSRSHADAFFQQVVDSRRIIQPILTHDARPLVGGGTGADCGIALIAGTGSFAYCRTADGTEDRCGGWGYLYGDEGSGYALGIAGLRAAVMAHDGRDQPTALVDGFRTWLQQDDVPSWLPELRTWDRDQIAGAAKVVCHAAALGDQTATRLIDQAAAALAHHLMTLWNRQFRGQPADLVLAGGLLAANESLRTQVVQAFLNAGGQCGTVTVVERTADAMIGMLRRVCSSVQPGGIN